MKKVFNLIAITIVFIGCVGNKNLTIPADKILTDKNSAYVVFMRPNTYVGAAYHPIISEYFPETKKATEVADLGVGEKVIYRINPGKHFFHIDYYYNTVHSLDAKAGEIYYFDTNKSMLISAIDKQEIEILSHTLIGQDCSQNLLDKYLLKENESEKLITKYTNLIFWLEIKCKENNIIYANYYSGMKTDELNSETELIQPSNKNLEDSKLSHIIEDFDIYIAKFYGIPYRNGISLSIVKDFDNKYYKNFNKSELEITFDEIKIDEGSQLARYFSFSPTQMQNSATTTKMSCILKSKKTGEIITIINGSYVTGSGILGGFDTGKKELLDIFNTYIQQNFYR